MIQLMFSFSRQPLQLCGWMIINFLTLLLVPYILGHFDLDHKIPASMLASRYYSLDFVLYWLLFNLVVFYTIVELEKYIHKVHHSRAMIEAQKDELTHLNQNLEKVVLLRTTALEEQNQKLIDYAFYNAHELKGPFCRIKGLLHLMELSDNENDRQEIKVRLRRSLEELGRKIDQIQVIVQDERPVLPVDHE
jgi:signal transduction histidine kinase